MNPILPVRVGLVGYGYAARTFHAPLIAAASGLTLAAVCSRDAAKVHADLPDIAVDATPDALFARADIDLVVIPTPNDTHHPLARAALLAGKHVVVDKPFTVTTAQGQELVALARDHSRVLSVFHNRRWDGDFMTLQRLLESGELGRVTHFESHFDRFRPLVRQRWREQAGPGSGLWFDLGPHLLDQALQLFGEPDAIALDRVAQRDGALTDDGFHAQLRYARGTHAGLRVVLHASALAAAPGPRFVVHGTRGSFVKHGLDPQEEALKTSLRVDPASLDAETGLLTLQDADNPDLLRTWVHPVLPARYTAYYEGLRDAIRSGGRNPVPPEDALRVMALLELGCDSDAQRRELPVPPQA